MKSQFWAVSTKYFDNGEVKAVLYAVHAETKPKNSIDEDNMYDHYIDYFNTYEEALQWYEQAKRYYKIERM